MASSSYNGEAGPCHGNVTPTPAAVLGPRLAQGVLLPKLDLDPDDHPRQGQGVRLKCGKILWFPSAVAGATFSLCQPELAWLGGGQR